MAIDPWELAGWDAVETLEHLAQKDITATQVVEAAITRAKESSWLNAVVTPTFENALEHSTQAKGPLAGVPFFLKDLVRSKGVRTAWGTAASGDYRASADDPSVKAFHALGLVSLGKSSTPELGLTATTEPAAFGACHNPWKRGHSTGGSSGGAAALVAGGVVPIAHASDGGGSIRIPAACCGLVGLKPTRGRFDMEGSNLLPINIAVHGVVSRTVRDTVMFWKALETVLPRTRWPAVGTAGTRPEKRLRVGVYIDLPTGQKIDPEVRATVEATASLLEQLGHRVEPVTCPASRQVLDDFVSLWSFVAWIQPRLSRFTVGQPFALDKLEPLTLGFGERFMRQKWVAFKELTRLRGWTEEFPRVLERLGVDVLLSPTLATLPPPHGYLSPEVPFETAFDRLYGFCPFTGMYNSAGAPALTLPLGKSASGLPIGVHLAAARGQEAMLLELGAELEGARPWVRAAPRVAA